MWARHALRIADLLGGDGGRLVGPVSIQGFVGGGGVGGARGDRVEWKGGRVVGGGVVGWWGGGAVGLERMGWGGRWGSEVWVLVSAWFFGDFFHKRDLLRCSSKC